MSTLNRILDLLFYPTKGNRNAANITTFIGWRLSQVSLGVFIGYGVYFAATGEKSAALWMSGLILAILGACCDFIDGNLARFLKIESDFGKSYDPSIDRMQLDSRIFAVLIDLVVTSQTTFFLGFVAVGYLLRQRNEKVSFLRTMALKKNPGAVVEALSIGKIRTAANFGLTFCLQILVCHFANDHLLIINMAAILTIDSISWIEYSKHYAPLTQDEDS